MHRESQAKSKIAIIVFTFRAAVVSYGVDGDVKAERG